MQEFETFVYLDVQKTGSTFITNLLQRFSSEKEIRFKKHAATGNKYDPGKFHFISVRDPRDQYISLYSHGCGGNGALYRRLRRLGHQDLYDSTWQGFKRWLKFVLRLENAELLDDDYGGPDAGSINALIGFQSYRFIELAMRDPVETIQACKNRNDLLDAYNEKKIVNFVVRNESLVEDMEKLLTTQLRNSISDLDGALKFLNEGHRLNASDRIDRFEDNPDLGPKNTRTLEEREWFLHELFGY
jgi:hypothetical protein